MNVVPIFRKQFLTALGFTPMTTTIGGPTEVRGNKAVVSGILLNESGVNGVTLHLDGSYDGLSWIELANVSVTAFGFFSVAKTGLDATTVRLRAVVGESSAVLFDATIVFSKQ